MHIIHDANKIGELVVELANFFDRKTEGHRHLKIAMGGGMPNFKYDKGEIKGVDIQLVRLLSKKLGFLYNIYNDPNLTGEQAVELVKSC